MGQERVLRTSALEAKKQQEFKRSYFCQLKSQSLWATVSEQVRGSVGLNWGCGLKFLTKSTLKIFSCKLCSHLHFLFLLCLRSVFLRAIYSTWSFTPKLTPLYSVVMYWHGSIICYSGLQVGKSSLGSSIENPALTCKDLKNKTPSVASGVYWIDPDGGYHGNAFQTYCDQQTDGGGWTLVWSYSFTDYKNFGSVSNAVTPRPTWTANGVNTRVSATVPLSETHNEAMDFALWRTIGNQVLIKSNINNWIACQEGSGSIVRQKAGSLSCKLVKQVS